MPHFALTTASSLHDIFSKAYRKLETEILLHVAITLSQIRQMHIHAATLPVYHKFFYYLHILSLWRSLKFTGLTVVFMNPVWWMNMASNNAQMDCGIQTVIDWLVPSPTPPPPAWTVDAKHVGSMDSKLLAPDSFLTVFERNPDSSDQSTFVHCSLRTFRWSSAVGDHPPWCKEYYDAVVAIGVTMAFMSAQTSLSILLWPLSSNKVFCLNPRDCCARKS